MMARRTITPAGCFWLAYGAIWLATAAGCATHAPVNAGAPPAPGLRCYVGGIDVSRLATRDARQLTAVGRVEKRQRLRRVGEAPGATDAYRPGVETDGMHTVLERKALGHHRA